MNGERHSGRSAIALVMVAIAAAVLGVGLLRVASSLDDVVDTVPALSHAVKVDAWQERLAMRENQELLADLVDALDALEALCTWAVPRDYPGHECDDRPPPPVLD